MALSVRLRARRFSFRRDSTFFVATYHTITPTRYVVGVIGFLLVWLVVAVVLGLIVTFFVSPANGQTVRLGIGIDWRNLPGTLVGLFAGIQSFQASVRKPKMKDDK